MKILLYLTLVAVNLILSTIASGADADLVNLIKGDQQSSTILSFLKPESKPSQITDGENRPLKRIIAFGYAFDGELDFNGGVQTKLLMWTQEPLITPKAGADLFEKMANALRIVFGQGNRIASIPNHGDASDVKSTAVFWTIGADIVLLQLDKYTSRAGINIVRRSSESWRSSMGADESEFWMRTLDELKDIEPSPEIPRQNSQGNESPPVAAPSPVVEPPTPKTAPEVKPTTSTPGDEPTSSITWSVIAILIAAVIGLAWLQLKKCK
jgi:hypothetical protein